MSILYYSYFNLDYDVFKSTVIANLMSGTSAIPVVVPVVVDVVEDDALDRTLFGLGQCDCTPETCSGCLRF